MADHGTERASVAVNLKELELPASELRRELDLCRSQRDRFATELEEARSSLLQLERDSAQVVTTLRAELKSSNTAVEELEATVNELKGGLSREHAAEREQLLAQLETVQSTFRQREQQLVQKNAELLADVTGQRAFKEERGRLMATVAETKKELLTAKESYKKDVTELERAFLAVQTRLEETSRLHLLNSRSAMREEATRQLDDESMKTRQENLRLLQELRFHEETSDALQTQNTALRDEIKALRMEVDLNSGRDTAFAARGLRQRKVIQELNAKVKELERALSQAVRDLEVERVSSAEKHQVAVQELDLQVDALQRSVQLKSKELRRIKGLAKTIVEQRTETETFFLEALEQVKNEIRAQRKERLAQAKAEYRQHLRTLALNKGVRLPGVERSGSASSKRGGVQHHERVDLAHLSLEDRERVLRVFFSKINGTQVAFANQLPKHSFSLPDAAPTPAAGQAAGLPARIEGPARPDPSFFVTDLGHE